MLAEPNTVEHDDRRPLPLLRWAAWLIGVALLAGLVQWSLVPLWTGDDETSRRLARKAVLAISVVTTVAFVFGLVPVTMLRRLGGSWAAFAFVAALPIRFALSLAGAVLIVVLGRMPAVTTVMTMVVVYLALLVSETILMVRFTNAASNDLFDPAGNRHP